MSTDEKRTIEDVLSKPQAAHAPPSQPEIVKAPDRPLPVGTQPLLDAQLGEALKIMRDYAEWVHHPRSVMEECLDVGNALAQLMTASATLATVAARLQQGEPETRHRMIVEYAEPEEEEGVGGSRKRINRG